MADQESKKIWKVRTVKNYPEAHNHLFIGRVLQLTQSYIRMDCRTYHFGKNINSTKDIKSGPESIRLIPWGRIELINELPYSFDYAEANIVIDSNSTVMLDDGKTICPLTSSYENR